MLTKDKFIEQISGISDTQWDALFAFIPVFESTKVYGGWTKPEQIGEGVFQIPKCNYTQEVHRFIETVYAIDLILSFGRMEWRDGIKTLNTRDKDFDDLDTIALCKLMTIVVRNDRFTEGYMLRCFKNGIVLKLLKSLERKVLLSRD